MFPSEKNSSVHYIIVITLKSLRPHEITDRLSPINCFPGVAVPLQPLSSSLQLTISLERHMAGLDLIFNGEELAGDLGFDYDEEKGDDVPSLVHPVRDDLDDETEDLLSNIDAYHELRNMEEEDLEDLSAIRLLFSKNHRQCKIKFYYNRMNWNDHVKMLERTGSFSSVIAWKPIGSTTYSTV